MPSIRVVPELQSKITFLELYMSELEALSKVTQIFVS